MSKTIDIISLGCSKNLVDSETLMGLMEANGYQCTHDSDDPQGEIVVVNTCGFINDAKEESINTILEFAQAKTEGRIEKLFVMGCLSERYLADLEKEIPEVDGWYGKFDWNAILKETGQKWFGEMGNERIVTTPSHYAYLKIAEGCNRGCAYCAIPLMTGKYQSRSQEDILDEARRLVAKGVKEIQLIAQDLTYYGTDVSHKPAIAELVQRLSDIPGIEWLRLHYGYPNSFPMDLLPVMRERDNVCKYMDIALQHISDPVLKRMHRNITARETRELLARMREEVPGIHLRTTLMVGFPGETDDDYALLLDFVKEQRFERLGAFAYCEVDGTYSALHYNDDVKDEVKQERLSRLMRIQQDISAKISAAKVGKTFKVMIDRIEGEYYVGRTEFDSPEVDPEVLVKADVELPVGEFADIRITEADAFDIYGTI